ncbi:MAG TPA: gamma-glutamyltransferase [Methylomirabilota bacterium]|nr:gamma-glutamyltransferase [Methylomirabilota bacterium]
MTEKRPATASRGMVVTNHPLGSSAGAEMLAAGGNAVDAAIGALFALTVVEPMMVGIFGAGMTHLRLADGRHLVIDNYTTAPAASRPEMFKPISDTWPDYLRAEGDVNLVGLLSVGVPGTLKAWAEAIARFGRLDLETVMQPAIRHAERGFRATPYLVAAVTETGPDLARFPETARTFLPGGAPIKAGHLIVMPEYAATLRLIAAKGPGALYGGDLGATVADYMRRDGGIITLDDLARYQTIERQPIRGRYRGFEITGPPPPTAGGLHLVEMLNILEGFDPRGLGFGTADYFHLIAEVLKIGFADRNACTGDPAFVDIPVERLISKEHADTRRRQIRLDRAGEYGATVAVTGGVAAGSAHTTHVTTADADGNVVAMTQTINNLFGSKATVPGTGILLNNTMALFDPHPGTPASIAPGKRVTSSMAPTIVLRDGKSTWALGLPGGVRIFTSVFQAVVNLIDHGMTLQEAVEAPRIWSQGQELEMEQDIPAAVRDAVAARGHRVVAVPGVAGGMNAVAFAGDGTLEGAACWRADGTPIGVSGGLARAGSRFRPDVIRR